MFPLLAKGDQTKLLKFFDGRFFPFATGGKPFSKKFETVLMDYSGTGGKLIHEKN
jgi:hypothetical protein